MKKFHPFFEADPPRGVDDRILSATGEALAQNQQEFRALQRRKKFMQWFLLPAFSLGAAALVYRFSDQNRASEEALMMAEFIELDPSDTIETEEDLDLISELELLEDLEELEKWEDS